MTQNLSEGLYKELTYRVIGLLYEVHNELGPVHKENVYREAVAIELKSQKIHFEKEKVIDVNYKGEKIGVYRPDFVIEDKVILELKAQCMSRFFTMSRGRLTSLCC